MFFHHIFFCDSVPRFSDQFIIDPALLIKCKGGIGISRYTKELCSVSGVPLEEENEFILKNFGILSDLSNIFKYVFFIISEKIYLESMPTFFPNEWDDELKIETLTTIGWTVYAFSEPGLLYGSYPIRFQEGIVAIDCKYINEWGLIKTEELAREIAEINNNAGDENSGHWAILGVCVDKITFSRLEEQKILGSESNFLSHKTSYAP